jgi:hypothetical protein
MSGAEEMEGEEQRVVRQGARKSGESARAGVWEQARRPESILGKIRGLSERQQARSGWASAVESSG